MKPTLHVIDDEEEVLKAISWLVNINGYKVEVYSSAESFLKSFKPNLIGCVLTDINLLEMDGMSLHSRVREVDPDLPVVVMTGYPTIKLAVEALKGGALDFIEKPFDNEALIEIIKHAFDVSIKKHEAKQIDRQLLTPFMGLTKREIEVFGLLIKGHTNKSASLILGISIRTIEVHRAKIMHKTKSRNLVELMALKVEAIIPN